MKQALLMFLFVTTACSVKIKNFEKYTKAPLLQLEEMPSKAEINQTMPRVVIVQAETESDEVKKSNAIKLIAQSLAQVLQNEKFATVVDRKHNNETRQEIKISEFSGKGMADGDAVDFIINISVTNVTFARQNLLRVVPVLVQNNVSLSSRPIYEYTSTVDGVMKIYKLPKMEIIKTIDIKGSHIEKENATAGNSSIELKNFSIDSSERITAKEYDSNIVYQAIKHAIHNAEKQVKNFFQKKGYILEKRALKKKYIFAINIGELNGIKPQSKIAVVRTTTTHNKLTDEDEEISQTICTGKIADKVFEKRAWIVFEKECQNQIRLGDQAKIIY